MSHSLRNTLSLLLLAILLVWVTPRAIAMMPGPIEEDDVPPPPTTVAPSFPDPGDITPLAPNVKLPIWQTLPVRHYAQCMSIGMPNYGALRGGVLFPRDNGYYVAERAERQWGTPETIDLLIYAAAKVQEQFGPSHKLYLGDISYRDGGRCTTHASHQCGRDADIGFYFKSGNPGYLANGNSGELDIKRNAAYIEALIETNQVEYIFLDMSIQAILYNYMKNHLHRSDEYLDQVFQYPGGRGTRQGIIRHARGHRNHYHVRFYSPIAVANAKNTQFYDGELAQLQQTMYGSSFASARNVRIVASQSSYSDYTASPRPRTTQRSSVGATTYTVRNGDSLWSIAKKHGITVNQLRAWNNLGASSRLKVGQKLTIYKGKKKSHSNLITETTWKAS